MAPLFVPPYLPMTCIICLDKVDQSSRNISCSVINHQVCDDCFNNYLKENVLTQVFKLRGSRCRVKCPDTTCPQHFDTWEMLEKMERAERSRFVSIIKEVMLKDANGDSLPFAKKIVELQECMTLKCPGCQATVDPTPDGCSAVMCLNCGAHYCNVCFECFNTGKGELDRSTAHTHAATHATHVPVERRSAFLPSSVVEKGQKSVLLNILKNKLVDMILDVNEENLPLQEMLHSVDITLVIVESELKDLGLGLSELRSVVTDEIMRAVKGKAKASKPSPKGAFDTLNMPTPPKRKRELSANSVTQSPRHMEGSNGNNQTRTTDIASTSSEADTSEERVQSSARSSNTRGSGSDAPPQGQEATSRDFRAKVNEKTKRKKEVDVELTGRMLRSTSMLGPVHAEERTRMEVEISCPPTEEGTQNVKKGGAAMANAILSDNQAAVQQLLTISDDEFDFDYIDSRHGHPLASLSILTGKNDLAANLLRRGADPLKHNTSGRTVLYIAVEAGAGELVEMMLDSLALKGIDGVNLVTTTEIQAYRPLHIAARYNHGRICEMLISRGAALDEREGEHGYTALTLGLVLGHEWAGVILVNAGAQVSTTVKSNNGRSPMFVAAEKGLSEVIELVLKTRDSFDVNEPVVVPSGLRLLHVAAFHKRAHVVEMLLKYGANVNITDEGGKSSALSMALIGKCPICSSILITAGADTESMNNTGKYPFDYALETGNFDTVRMFLEECSVDVNAFTNYNDKHCLPLNKVISKGHRHLVPYLVARGAHIDGIEGSVPPLVTAVNSEDIWVVQYLLKNGASLSVESTDGLSLLHLVVQKGNCAILQSLVDHGADINESSKGVPPLCFASQKDDPWIAVKLLSLGANLDAKDVQGRSAHDIALESESFAVAAVLERAMRETPDKAKA